MAYSDACKTWHKHTRMIIFFRKVEHMSVVFKHVVSTLGSKDYINYQENGRNDDRNRLIYMFHMKAADVVGWFVVLGLTAL